MKYQHLINHNFLDNINEHSAYFLGFFMADGYLRKNMVKFCIHEQDKEILEYFQQHICFKIPIRYSDKTRPHIINWSFTSIDITNKLYNMRIVTPKTGKEIFPDIPQKYERDFIRGYFDGDGSIFKTKNRVVAKIVCANKTFLEILQKKIKVNKNIYQGKNSYNFTLCHRDSNVLKNYMYYNGCFALKRKYNKFQIYVKSLSELSVFDETKINILKNNNLSIKEMVQLTGYTENNIRRKLYRLNTYKFPQRFYTKKEISLIKTYFNKTDWFNSINYIATILDRHPIKIMNKLIQLRLGYYHRRYQKCL